MSSKDSSSTYLISNSTASLIVVHQVGPIEADEKNVYDSNIKENSDNKENSDHKENSEKPSSLEIVLEQVNREENVSQFAEQFFFSLFKFVRHYQLQQGFLALRCNWSKHLVSKSASYQRIRNSVNYQIFPPSENEQAGPQLTNERMDQRAKNDQIISMPINTGPQFPNESKVVQSKQSGQWRRRRWLYGILAGLSCVTVVVVLALIPVYTSRNKSTTEDNLIEELKSKGGPWVRDLVENHSFTKSSPHPGTLFIYSLGDNGHVFSAYYHPTKAHTATTSGKDDSRKIDLAPAGQWAISIQAKSDDPKKNRVFYNTLA